METELRELGWSEADAKRIAATPVTTRHFDYKDLPITITARWVDDYPFWDGTLSWWRTSRGRPFDLGKALFFAHRSPAPSSTSCVG